MTETKTIKETKNNKLDQDIRTKDLEQKITDLEKQNQLSNKFKFNPEKYTSDLINSIKKAIKKSGKGSGSVGGSGGNEPNPTNSDSESDDDSGDKSETLPNPNDNQSKDWLQENKQLLLIGGSLLFIFYLLNQKEKIINTFLRLLPEKELAQQLITTHLEFIRFKKQATEQAGYRKIKKSYEHKILELKNELEEKLNEEQMDKIEAILTDCEELINQELELEAKLTDKSVLIASQKQNTFSEKEREIIAQNNEIQQKQLEELELLRRQSTLILQELNANQTQSLVLVPPKQN